MSACDKGPDEYPHKRAERNRQDCAPQLPTPISRSAALGIDNLTRHHLYRVPVGVVDFGDARALQQLAHRDEGIPGPLKVFDD